MPHALWTLIKLLAVTGIIILLMEQEGTLQLEWNEYVLSVHLGMALVALLLFLIILLFFHKIGLELLTVPRVWRSYWKEKALRKGHIAVTKSLVALAAGDHKHAAYHAYRAQKLISDHYDSSVPAFIEAQSARLMGQNERASKQFSLLLENKESAFLGIRGLMQTEIESKNYLQALEMAYSADRMHPNQPWIVRTIYDLEIQTHRWDLVLATLKRLEKLKALEPDKIKKDRTTILVMLADKALGKEDISQAKSLLKKALSINSGFIPANTRLIHLAIENNQKRKARILIEKAWKATPHPDLIKFWDLLSLENTPSKPTARLTWYKHLIDLNPHAVEGQLAIAQIALDDGLWGEARTHLTKAEQLDAHAGVYLAWAELERLSTQNDVAVQAWLKKAQTVKQPKTWVCQITGDIYETWYAIAEPRGVFNSIEWAYPNKRQKLALSGEAHGQDPLLFDSSQGAL